ncbi:hypothetical protein P1J78_08790 [Psychromarinibacter sp. C21-152]|uniref:Uncharacterized protein n=1 Tax=Psychromarinibacter sediminicola TaxID=3033385 RepID=A0AAE3NTV1_9RHOB|nr:hypothetical protein [Psychromarinibacter sediminicola]MDF0600825.1 hypothetical protein [Psychromarinibacter sediminicola]
MLKFVLAAAVALCGLPAAAQTVIPCDGWQASARNIAEPWSAHTRTFANGDVRVALLDTIEPAAGAFYLLVLTPPYGELGSRTCGLVAADGGSMGLAGLDFGNVGASYDPATGLTLRFPAQRYAPATGGYDPAILAVTINQATGAITPRFEVP